MTQSAGFQDGCGPKLYSWFEDNKITWVSILASMAALEVLCVGIAIYILTRVKKLEKLRQVKRLALTELWNLGV
jgi:hypothetical protein